MGKIGQLVGKAMGRMARVFDKLQHTAPDLEAFGDGQRFYNRKERRRMKYGNRYYATGKGQGHTQNPAGTKIARLFPSGRATQRHPG